MKSTQISNAKSVLDLGEIHKEDFSSKVVKFSLNDDTKDRREASKNAIKNLNKLRASCRKASNPSAHPKQKSIEKSFTSQNPLSSEQSESNKPVKPSNTSSEVSSTKYKSNQPKRKAVINLKNLLMSKSNKENNSLKAELPLKDKTEIKEDASRLFSEVKQNIPTFSNNEDKEIIPHKDISSILGQSIHEYKESYESEQVFNDELIQSTHRTMNNYETQNFEACPDSCYETDTVPQETKPTLMKAIKEVTNSYTSLTESMKPLSDENTERENLRYFKPIKSISRPY